MSEIQAGSFEQPRLAASAVREAAFGATAVLIALTVAKLAVQFAGIRHYGFFRDELYYMACGRHLAWGYVDQPPLVALLAWLEMHLFGSSIVSIRLLAALAGAGVVFLTGIFTRELGGGRFAQFLAAVTILLTPAYLAFDSFFSMNALEPLLWLLCSWIVVRILKGESSPKTWLAFGVVAGIGLENKHTMLVICAAIMAGLLIERRWDLFRSPWIWLGGVLALAIFLPNLLWEARHGWPQIEVVRNGQLMKNLPLTPWEFLGQQFVFLNPVAAPVWLAGLVWYFSRDGKPFRFLGWGYFVVLAVVFFGDGKAYYPLPVYGMLVAAGGVAIEAFARRAGWRWLRTAVPAAVVITGLIALPFGVPILPLDAFVRYSGMLPYSHLAKTEREALGSDLPQLYADMLGWDSLASTVAGVYNSLPANERSGCAIVAGNYGEAGAIDYYGPALGLPAAISGHNSYFDWGPRNYSGSCVILFGDFASDHIKLFRDVRQAATIRNPLGMPNERVVPVYICRQPIAPLSILWPQFRMII